MATFRYCCAVFTQGWDGAESDDGCLIFIIIYVGLNRFTIYILYGWRH